MIKIVGFIHWLIYNYIDAKRRDGSFQIVQYWIFESVVFYMWQTPGCQWGSGLRGLMSHISAAHLPVCVNYWQLAACESGRGHTGCSLGVQNSKWNTGEHVRVAKSRCIYVARIQVSRIWRRVRCSDFLSHESEGCTLRYRTAWRTDTISCTGKPERSSPDSVTFSPFTPNTSPGTWMHLCHLDTTLQFEPMHSQPNMYSHFQFLVTVQCTKFGYMYRCALR